MIDDLRYALRGLRNNPGFTLVAVLTLALAIGANTAVFSVVRGLLWRPLPFPEPDRLVAVRGANPARAITDYELSLTDLADLEAQATSFTGFASFVTRQGSITAEDGAERVDAAVADPELFRVVGIAPLAGRTFRPDEATPGASPVAVLSYGLWRRRFGGDTSIVGRTVPIDGLARTIVGVLPRAFDFERVDVWLPLIPDLAVPRSDRFARGMARLRSGVSVEQARRELVALAGRLEQQYPTTNRGWSVEVLRYRDDIVDPGSQLRLRLMLGAVVLVLLIACANVAGLLLARAAARGRELAVRSAIGASAARLRRQLLVESLVLAGAGALVGVLLAAWWTDALLSTLPLEDVPPWLDVSLDGRVLAMTALTAGLSAILFGLVPALRASRPNVVIALKGSDRGVVGSAGRFRRALVVGQVALTVVLLAAAAQFVQGFAAARGGDLGFDDRNVMTARAYFEPISVRPGAERVAWMRDALARVRQLPGVAAAALTGSVPGDDGGDRQPLTVEGRPVATGDELFVVAVPSSDGFFEALGVRLIAGRGFTPAEAEHPGAPVAVIGRTLAERLWPGENALGRRIRLSDEPGWLTIVGVALDLQYEEFGEDVLADRLQVHVPYGRELWRNVAVLARTEGPPARLATTIRQALRGVAAHVPVYAVRTFGEVRSETTAGDRLLVFVFGTFGAQALLVAAIGLYGLLAYGVEQRRREIGVRMALGARPASIVALVMAQATGLAGAGLALGLVGGAAVARGLEGLVWGVTATLEPLAAVCGVLLLTALAAAFVPTRRATRVDPMVVLREE